MGQFTSHNPDKLVSPLSTSDGFVSGWAYDSLRPQVTITLLVDGKEVLTGLTGHRVADEFYTHYAPPTAECGFKLPLPKVALDGFSHQLTIKVNEWRATASAPTASLTYFHGICFGEVSYSAAGYIEGWVGFRSAIDAAKLPPVRVGQQNKTQYSINLTHTKAAATPEYQVMAKFRVPQSQISDLENPVFSCLGTELRLNKNTLSAKFIGQLEEITHQAIKGWALNSADPLDVVNLLLVVDGLPIAPIRPNIRRNEIAAELGLLPEEIGLSGFYISLPKQLKDGLPHTVAVHCLTDGNPLNNKSLQYQYAPAYISLENAQRLLEKPTPQREQQPNCPKNPTVSVVILNRNGANCLTALFESWQRYNSVAVEIIVIDHASTDESIKLLDSWVNKIPLQIVQLDYNDSFSASCNRGARLAKAPFVLFLNNDIILLQDILPTLLSSLEDPQIGIVGLKLLKAQVNVTGERNLIAMSPVQHLGVRYTLVEDQYWPYEVTPNYGLPEEEYSAQDVPIVTGAVMLCRRAEFLELGGFDEGYIYGYEDVEFCLRLSHQKGLRVVCRNDLTALHHHGYTRLTGREPQMINHQINNINRLAKQLGLWAKRNYWQSLLSTHNLFSNEALTLGFAIQYPLVSAEHKAQLETAIALAENTQVQYPAIKPVFLRADQGWENVDGIHVLIAMSPYFDLRNIKQARADLRSACYIQDEKQLGAWAINPSIGLFDDGLCADEVLVNQATILIPQLAKYTVISNTNPLENILDPNRLRIQLHPGNNTLELNQMAQVIAQTLKAQDALVSIGTDTPVVVDIIIYLYSDEASSTANKHIPFERRADVFNVLWLLKADKQLEMQALKDADQIWSADTQWPKHLTPKPQNVKIVKPHSKSMQGLVKHLQLIIEEKIGNTFRPS